MVISDDIAFEKICVWRNFSPRKRLKEADPSIDSSDAANSRISCPNFGFSGSLKCEPHDGRPQTYRNPVQALPTMVTTHFPALPRARASTPAPDQIQTFPKTDGIAAVASASATPRAPAQTVPAPHTNTANRSSAPAPGTSPTASGCSPPPSARPCPRSTP